MSTARNFRLIDGCFEPHQQLDALYSTVEEAMSEAVDWLQQRPMDAHQQLIGVEVSSANGDWRTYRLPTRLLCDLPG